jgi:hypothetical protein
VRACNVRLAVEPDVLRLEIGDDGVGLASPLPDVVVMDINLPGP